MITREDNVAMNMGRGAYGKLELEMHASCTGLGANTVRADTTGVPKPKPPPPKKR